MGERSLLWAWLWPASPWWPMAFLRCRVDTALPLAARHYDLRWSLAWQWPGTVLAVYDLDL